MGFLKNYWSDADEDLMRREWGDEEFFQFVYTYGIAFGDITVAQAAIDNGVSIDAPIFGHGATAMVGAVGNELVVRFLLERGASVNVADWEGVTPLHNAIRNRNISVVWLLLEYGANPNATNQWGSALEVAKEEQAEDIADLLIQAGAVE